MTPPALTTGTPPLALATCTAPLALACSTPPATHIHPTPPTFARKHSRRRAGVALHLPSPAVAALHAAITAAATAAAGGRRCTSFPPDLLLPGIRYGTSGWNSYLCWEGERKGSRHRRLSRGLCIWWGWGRRSRQQWRHGAWKGKGRWKRSSSRWHWASDGGNNGEQRKCQFKPY